MCATARVLPFRRFSSELASIATAAPAHEPLQNALPNDIEFSGERKRVRCNELLEGARALR